MGVAAAVYEIRTTGSTTNGGGFVTGASGVDKSQQDAAGWALTGVTSAGAGNTVLDANAHADMVGNIACVVSGTNFTQSFFEVLSVVANTSITFSTNKAGTSICTGVGSNGVINIGGAFKLGATSAGRTDDDFFEMVPDNTGGSKFWFKYNASAHSVGTSISVSSSADGVVTLHNEVEGYYSTRGDRPSIASGNQPVIAAGALSFNLAAYTSIRNITGTTTTANGFLATTSGMVIDCKFTNSSGTANRNALTINGALCLVTGCELISTNGYALGVGNTGLQATNNYIHDSSVGIKATAATASNFLILNNIIDTVVVSGIDFTAGAATNCLQIIGNTIYCAATPAGSSSGIAFAASSGGIVIQNNIITGAVTGINGSGAITVYRTGYNNLYNNTTNATNWTLDSTDIALDPAFVNAGSGNFATGTNVQRVGYPGTFPGGLTVGYRDIGAVQANGSAWWSVPAAGDIRSGITARDNSITVNVTGTLSATGGGRSRMASNGTKLTLLENASATGSAFLWPGGQGQFYAEATWGGGTVKLQAQTPNGTWIDVDSASLTANGHKTFTIPPGTIRANVATSTAVYAYAVTV